MIANISPSKLSGSVIIPPSKSYAHRMIICSALSRGTSTIYGISKSQDILATLNSAKSLGADVKIIGDCAKITGFARNIEEKPVFSCNESGSTLRFLIPIAMAMTGSAVFLGEPRLIERGIGVYEDVFSDKGIKFVKENDKIIANGRLSAGKFTVCGNISSQFITGLMFALSTLDGESEIEVLPPVESKPYIDITIDVLNKFGVKIKQDKNSYFIKKQTFYPQNLTVEGDWSNSAFYFAENALGSSIKILGLNENSIQGDRAVAEIVHLLDEKNLKTDLTNCPDLAPVLFSLSALKNGAEFLGTKRLKIKESDRAEAMKAELAKCGVLTKISENSVLVIPENLKPPQELIKGHNDHRIVMAMTLILSKLGGKIDDIESVNKSYPTFFEELEKLGLEVSYEA